MYIERYEGLVGSSYPAGLSVLTAGFAVCDGGWRGGVVDPPYSRLYFIQSGELLISGDRATEICAVGEIPERADFAERRERESEKEKSEPSFRLASGGCYLIPAGYSFNYLAEGELSHLYFHLQLRGYGGIDELGNISAPVALRIGDEAISELIEVCRGRDAVSELSASHRLLAYLEELIRLSGLTVRKRTLCREIEEAIKYIGEHPRIGLRLSEIASHIHISERTLTRKFKLLVGMSVGEYIERIVLGLCERDLLYSELSLSEIGEKYGFCDRFYFSRKFKARYGLPPRQYRDKGAL